MRCYHLLGDIGGGEEACASLPCIPRIAPCPSATLLRWHIEIPETEPCRSLPPLIARVRIQRPGNLLPMALNLLPLAKLHWGRVYYECRTGFWPKSVWGAVIADLRRRGLWEIGLELSYDVLSILRGDPLMLRMGQVDRHSEVLPSAMRGSLLWVGLRTRSTAPGASLVTDHLRTVMTSMPTKLA